VRRPTISIALMIALGCGQSTGGQPVDAGASLDAPVSLGSWSDSVPLPQRRFEAKAVAFRGQIVYLGGITDLCDGASSPCPSDHVDIFDPGTQAWSSGPPLPANAPRHHVAVTVQGDRVYLLGGWTGIIGQGTSFTAIPTTWVFDGASWTQLADQPVARGAATAESIGGLIYVAGGAVTEDGNQLADLYAYNPATDTWTQLTSMPTAREHVASCRVDGKMLVAGGWVGTAPDVVVATAELYDPRTDTWASLPDMPTARGGLGAAAIGDVCYFIGGEVWAGPDPGTVDANEGFALATGWRAYAPLPLARHGIGVATTGAEIYVVGGGPMRANSYTDQVNIFTP
jgi:N-acetylneuraminic acid mutarotase